MLRHALRGSRLPYQSRRLSTHVRKVINSLWDMAKLMCSLVFAAVSDYCEVEGNVCGATATQTGSSSSITSVPSGCYSLLDIVSDCASSHSGIETAPVKSQAGCYCYTSSSRSTSWVPDIFDDYASECADWAHTADTSDYSAWSELATFCHSVGNFLTSATTTKTTSSTKTTTTPTAAQTGQNTSGTSSSATAVTVTVNPTPTSTNAAGTAYGQGSVAFGLAGFIMALFSYFL
jgi:hypothetical protein